MSRIFLSSPRVLVKLICIGTASKNACLRNRSFDFGSIGDPVMNKSYGICAFSTKSGQLPSGSYLLDPPHTLPLLAYTDPPQPLPPDPSPLGLYLPRPSPPQSEFRFQPLHQDWRSFDPSQAMDVFCSDCWVSFLVFSVFLCFLRETECPLVWTWLTIHLKKNKLLLDQDWSK